MMEGDAPSQPAVIRLVALLREYARDMGVPVHRVRRAAFTAATPGGYGYKPHMTWDDLRVLASSDAGHPLEPPLSVPGADVYAPPEPGLPLDDLIAARKREYDRRHAHEEARALIRIDIKIDGPIGILHFGDPHIDDDGTDLAALERHSDLVRVTPGLFAANIGDTTNNWIGRLAKLYAEQGTSAHDAWRLGEWFIERTPWLYVIGGNHDMWSGDGSPLRWICRQAGALYQSSEARVGLRFSGGREIRVNARHDFAGHSQWNPAHGAMKAAQFGTRDHIMVNGHKHISGYGVVRDPVNGVVSHCIQIASYKIHDRYARERGLRDQAISPCALTVIDPAASEASTVQVFWEPELGAEYLTWLRSRMA